MFIKFCDNLQEKSYADFTSFPIISVGGNWDWALNAVAALPENWQQPRKPTLGVFANRVPENQGTGHCLRPLPRNRAAPSGEDSSAIYAGSNPL
jgi:hypothetical protein